MKSTINILIVDDHHLVRQGIGMLLKDQDSYDFTIHEVDDGDKSLAVYKLHDIDVVLMDITMERMNGIDATKAIIRHDRSAKIIALSMHNETFMIKKMLNAGASGYLLKDTETEELTRAIKTVMSGQNYFNNEVSLKLMGQFKENKRVEYNVDKSGSFKISKREIQVLNLIAKQYTNEEIATELEISKRTVDSHRQKMLSKLGLKNTAGLVLYGVKNHLINP